MLYGKTTRQSMYVKRNIEEAPSHKNFCRGKARSITYSKCVSLVLVIQHKKHMHHITFPSVTCLALQHFSTLSH